MRKILLIALIMSTTNVFTLFSQDDYEYHWKTIVKSSNIYRINTDDLKNGIINIEIKKYAEINIPVTKTLKGEIKDTIVLRIYMHEENYKYIKSLPALPDRTEAVIYLQKLYNKYGQEYGNEYNYFLVNDINDSIEIYTEQLSNYIEQEINFKNKIINEKLYENFQTNSTVYRVVTDSIKNITNKTLELDSFESLEEIGEAGVPYIICALNDFRTLPIRNISLRNHSKNAFEGTRHYSPYLVVDALAAILNQITGERFGFIYNGDDTTNEEKEMAIKGWYVYLYYLLNPRRRAAGVFTLIE
ncbi:MAG: hypothetical protein Ta2B_30720 [Termitinemataceae bacterium]|nr:MAG: hypothetical protein Ta2B_30720 [Termitinemataceae bacterium]